MRMKIDALFISDVHLGSKGSNANEVLTVLKQYQPEYLFLVGDIIDGWLLKRKFRWPQSHTNVLRKILSYSKNGTKVIYIPGNHDEFMRDYLELSFGNIEVHNEYVWNNTIENIIVTTKKIEVDYCLIVDVDYSSDTFISLNTDTNMKTCNFNYFNYLSF